MEWFRVAVGITAFVFYCVLAWLFMMTCINNEDC